MTTIIVIVLGVTLLILGLAFLQGTFKKIGELTDKTFEEGESALQNLGTITEPLTLTSSRVALEQGGSKGIGVVVLNDQTSQGSYTLTASRGAKTMSSGIECYFASTETTTVGPVTLGSGATEDFVLAIVDSGSDLGTYACSVALTDSSGVQVSQESLLIQIETD